MDTRPLIEELKRAEQATRRKIEELRKPMAQAEEDLHSLIGTIAFYERHLPSSITVSVSSAPAVSLHGMTHKQAVVAIAKHNGGVLKAQTAKQLMIQAGIMRNTPNATHMVHNAIITSDRFERIGRGEFRLKPIGIKLSVNNGVSSGAPTAVAAGLFPPKPPLQ